jgi:Zn-dependent protease with chaperone function
VGLAKPRLNPFAFPSDMDFRLLILVAAVIGSGLFIYNWMYFGLPSQSIADLAVYQQCQQLAKTAFPTDPFAASAAFDRCRAPVEQKKAVWMVGGVVLMLALAIALYLLAPLIKLRRQRLMPLTADDAPDVIASLQDLCVRAGLRSAPQFVWNPLNGAAVGLAFGRRGSYYVALTGGLVARFYSDRAAFDAVLLHELGHLRNGDVDKTYLALSLWQAFVALALVPLAATTVLLHDPLTAAGNVGLLGWRVLALAVLVYLVRNAVLRSRETYADLRALTWEGSDGALRRVLGGLPETQRTGLGRWRDAFQVHPGRTARQQALTDTRPLFRIGFWESFATGLAAGIAYPSVVSFILLFWTGIQLNVWSFTTGEVAGFITSTLLSLMIAGVIGVGIWRASFVAMIDGHRTSSLAAIAGGLVLGLGIGDWVGFEGGFQTLPSNPVAAVLWFMFYLLVMALLAGGLLLVLRWFAGMSRQSLRSALGHASAPHWLPSFLMIALVLAIWLGVTLQARHLLEAGSLPGVSPWLYPVLVGGPFFQAVLSPLGLLALVFLCAFPLLATMRVSTRTTLPSWAFLDPPPDDRYSSPRRPGFRRLLFIALAGAVAYGIIVGLMRLAIGSTKHMSDNQLVLVFVAEVFVAVLIQGCLAVVATSKADVMPIAQGVGAALLAGSLMAVETFWINVAGGGQVVPAFAWTLLTTTLCAGAPVALTLAWVTTLLTKRTGGT